MQRAVDDVEGRASRPVVEQPIVVEGHDGDPTVGEMLGRGTRGARRVDPPVERDHQDGSDQGVGECADAQQGHVRSIVAVAG